MSELYGDAYTDYQKNRSSFRKFVRRAYLRSAQNKLTGKVLDFGCGVGELLERLPVGSMGLEYNRKTVDYCRGKGLDVHWYDGLQDDWSLSVISEGRRFDSMIVSHVLEHLDTPGQVLGKLLCSAAHLGISRVLVVVPGHAGYAKDATHRTFVDAELLNADFVTAGSGFAKTQERYFPGNHRLIGEYFRYHELQVVYGRDGTNGPTSDLKGNT